MDRDKGQLKKAGGCGVVFQPMAQPTVPQGFQEELYGFDIETDDRPGIVAEVTALLAARGLLIVGHIGERMIVPGPERKVRGGQKYLAMLPHDFDHAAFNHQLSLALKNYDGHMKTTLRPVPGLLWWW